MDNVGILTALAGGLISFVSPCVLPLVPPYLCYIGGVSIEELGQPESTAKRRRDVVLAALAFVLGFSTVFVALGATASVFGQAVRRLIALQVTVFGTASRSSRLPPAWSSPDGPAFPRACSAWRSFRARRAINVREKPPGLVRRLCASASPSRSAGRRASVRSSRRSWRSPASGHGRERRLPALRLFARARHSLPARRGLRARLPRLVRGFRRYLPTVEKAMGAFLVLTGVLSSPARWHGSPTGCWRPFPASRRWDNAPGSRLDASGRLPDGEAHEPFPAPSKAILADIDARSGEREAFLAKLVQTPSSNPPGDCAAIADVATELLEGLGLTVERHPVPKDLVREAGMISATNLVVRRRFGDGPVIALNAHGDVVAPGEGWTHPPFGAEVVDGVMYGRGVAVSKSDFATYAFALLALESVADHLKGTVELHFTFDEEAGGLIGPKWLLDKRHREAGLLHLRRPRLFDRHRPQRRAAPRGDDPRQVRARRRARHRP